CMGVRYPDLSQALPADAEVLSIGVRLKHADWRYVLTQANPRPVLHGLDIDLGDTYDDFPAGPNDPPLPAVSGFEDLIADPIPVGTASTFMLPDAWVEALVAGDITGLLAWSPLEENSIVFDAYDCWDLYVTYVTPIETLGWLQMASLAEELQGGPYPHPDDDADLSNDLKDIVEWAAERSVMRFSSTTERDSLLPSPIEGQVCATGS